MNILFRVDADTQMGMGHLMRCLALAQALVQRQCAVFFAIKETTKQYCLSRQDWVGELLTLADFSGIKQEAAYLVHYVDEKKVDVLVLDGYQFDADYRRDLAHANSRFVVFDDNNDSGQLYADIVINSAANSKRLGYQNTAPQAKYCVGEKYCILRQEFLTEEVRLASKHWNTRQALTLVMGGSDPQNISLHLLKALEKVDFSSPIILATGGAYSQLEQLASFLKQTSLNVKHYPNCQNMAALFTQSRLVVSAAGGTQFELLACACPAFLLVVADNQLNASQQAVKQHWCKMFDLRVKPKLASLAKQLAAIWSNETQLETMHQRAKQCADIEGTSRVVEILLDKQRGAL